MLGINTKHQELRQESPFSLAYPKNWGVSWLFLLRTRWHKVLRDLWLNKARTLLVVLSISVGVFAVGVISGSGIILSRELANSYAAINPAHATILSLDRFDEEFVEAVRAMPEIEEAEARGSVFARIETAPDEWRMLQLVAIPDFDDIRIDKVNSESGAWPPDKHEILIERSALGLTEAEVGDVIHIKAPNGKERDVRIAGLAHDLYAKLYVLDGMAYGYITFDTLEWLGESRDYTELRVRVAENQEDKAHIEVVANKVQDKLEKGGRTVLFTLIPNPGEHPLDYVIQAITLLLGVLGILALFLSCFLVINTISAVLTQQVRQIGLMKAFGARAPDIMGMYMVMVLLFGLLTLLVAVPLGGWGAHQFTILMSDFFNFDVSQFQMPTEVLALEVAVGLLVPLVAGLYPIWAGTRVSVLDAVTDYGVGQGSFGKGWLDRLLMAGDSWLAFSRPLLLSLRNTFRRKKRLALTLVTLTLAGATFIAVFSVYASFQSTLDNILAYYEYDVAIQMARPYRVQRLTQESLQVPGVVAAEPWGFYNTRLVRSDGTHSGNIILFAPPADTQLVKPTLKEGRWLLPGDENAVVVNTIMLRDEPDIGVGDEIQLKIEGEETTWRLVGIMQGGQLTASAFVNYPALAREVGEVGRAEWLMILTEEHDLDYQADVLRRLDQQFEKRGLRVSLSSKVAEERAEIEALFQVIVVLLFVMTILVAAVGGLGLMGTMSINVLERTREIGIMRAIGASDRTVLQIFLVEGILIGLLSWAIGALLAFPVSKFMSDAVGQQFINAPLDYVFESNGIVIWFLVVVILASLASLLPAWNASRLTVREVLSYE
ncbi:MAG: ABC transporter permease [Ardenticatenaceae bacterium]